MAYGEGDPEAEARVKTFEQGLLPTPFTSTHRHSIIQATAANRLPAIYPLSFFAEDGGLIICGSDGRDIFRRAASYVDRILKDERPETYRSNSRSGPR
ncbi:MAG: hypothetical protein K2Z80_34320 [Xanthobacteraceae bacterium]|nr:hypothetical protein [Xanthobacteraceae bacterium]